MSLTTTSARLRNIGLALALGSTAFVWSTTSVASEAASFVPVEPARLVETRANAATGTIDGESFGEGRVGAQTVTSFVAAGRAGVAADASAVVLNVTIVAPAANGFATVFPCPSGTPSADDVPNASSVNMQRGATVANSLLVGVGGQQRVCVFSSVAAHLVVDVSGYSSGDSPAALNPARLVETRQDATPTTDGEFAGDGTVRAGAIYRFSAAGRGGVPGDAAAVSLNVAAVRPETAGFLTVFPCPSGEAAESDVPTASNLNFTAGQNVANSAMTRVGTGGDVCVFTSATTHIVVDVNGYVPAGGAPRALAPIRLLETRPGDDSSTIDGRDVGAGRLGGGSITVLQVAGRGSIEATSSAVVFNITAISPTSRGYLTLFPCAPGSAAQDDVPTASNINFSAGRTVANSAFVGLGTGGQVCIFTSATTHVAIDASASAPEASGGNAVPPTTTTTTTPPPTTSGSQPPSTGPHSFSATVRGEPVRWDPCSTITYRTDLRRGSQADADELDAAIARVEQATGIDFVSSGSYREDFAGGNGTAPQPDGPSDAEVGLVLTDDDVVGAFAGNLLGYAYIQWSGGNGEIVNGSVTLDVTPGGGIDKELVWMHELGHLVGLGHVDAAGQLMQARYDNTLDGFGDGDREGLWRVGGAQPCFFTSAQADPDLETTFHGFDPDGHEGHADH